MTSTEQAYIKQSTEAMHLYITHYLSRLW